MKPFYRQTWFMVALAAASLVVLIMVIAILCVKSKSYKYKRKFILVKKFAMSSFFSYKNFKLLFYL